VLTNFSPRRLFVLQLLLLTYSVYAVVDAYVLGWRTDYAFSGVARFGLPVAAMAAGLFAVRVRRLRSSSFIGWFGLGVVAFQFLIAFGAAQPWIGLVLGAAFAVVAPPRIPRLGRRARRHLLFAHVAFSVGWLGIGSTMLLLSLVGLVEGETALGGHVYELMHLMDLALVIPFVLASIISGIALSLATSWGLTKHWWVFVKFLISLTILLVAAFYESFLVRQLAGTLDSSAQDAGKRLQLFVCMAGFVLMLVVATALSTYKPRGLTPWTRRRTKVEPSQDERTLEPAA
jgi:uncharacterized membrane protein